MPAALDGVTVLDLSEWIAGPYASKLFADAGADVIKVERPGGDPSRGVGPFAGGTPHREKSGTFFYFNSGKRSVVLDLKQRRRGTPSCASSTAPTSCWRASAPACSTGSASAGSASTRASPRSRWSRWRPSGRTAPTATTS